MTSNANRRPATPRPLIEGGTTKWQNSGRLSAAGRGGLGKCAKPHGGGRRHLCMGLFSMFLLRGYEQEDGARTRDVAWGSEG